MKDRAQGGTATGRAAAIRGGVVDVAFTGEAPRIHALVHAGDVALEVACLAGPGLVRCIALGPVRRLGLGARVSTSGAGIEVPVGDAVLGRMLNLFGHPIDGLPAIADAERGPIRHFAAKRSAVSAWLAGFGIGICP